MKLAERFRRMVEGMPPGGSITLPVDAVREWLDECATGFEPDLTVEDVARIMSRSPTTVRAWIRSGELEAYKFNNREYRVTHAALQWLMDKARTSRLK